MTSTLHVLRVSDKANIDNRQGVRMTSTGTNTCTKTAGYVQLLAIDHGSLALSTCNVLVTYKVLALVCA
jgi:hypothetical protein